MSTTQPKHCCARNTSIFTNDCATEHSASVVVAVVTEHGSGHDNVIDKALAMEARADRRVSRPLLSPNDDSGDDDDCRCVNECFLC